MPNRNTQFVPKIVYAGIPMGATAFTAVMTTTLILTICALAAMIFWIWIINKN